MRLSTWPAALCSGALLAGCALEADYSGVATNPVTMVCDGGRTFSVAYASNFETAVIEAEGRRFELPRLYTAASLNPEPPRFGERRVSPRSRGAVGEERRPSASITAVSKLSAYATLKVRPPSHTIVTGLVATPL